jgi:hypothetical protein
MSYQSAFLQNGATQVFTAAVTPPNALKVLPTFTAALGPVNQFRIVNSGSTIAFLGAGPTAAVAAANAAVVTSAGNAIPILPGAVEVFSFPPAWFFTLSTSASTTTVFITPGAGL